jgi:hypothetical protein
LVNLDLLRNNGRDLLEYLSRGTRYGIRRSIRLYEQWGPLCIVRASSGQEGLVWLDELRRLHQDRWTTKGKIGAFGHPFFGKFDRSIVERSKSDRWDLLKITAGETPIGYLVNLSYNGITMNYQSGFRYESNNRYKPGLVSHILAVRYLLANRPDIKAYSFLAGGAQYKHSLSTSREQLNWYNIKPRG